MADANKSQMFSLLRDTIRAFGHLHRDIGVRMASHVVAESETNGSERAIGLDVDDDVRASWGRGSSQSKVIAALLLCASHLVISADFG